MKKIIKNKNKMKVKRENKINSSLIFTTLISIGKMLG